MAATTRVLMASRATTRSAEVGPLKSRTMASSMSATMNRTVKSQMVIPRSS